MTENGAWIRAWCAFGSVSGLPMGDFLRLIRETGGPEEAADAPYATHLKILGAKGADALRRARDEEVFEATKAWLERCSDAHVWTVLDEDFPVRFLHAERSPLCLFVRGNRRLLSGTVILVAGDGADEETLYNTAEFSRSVLEAGYVPSYANRSALEKVGIRAIISSPYSSAVVWTPGAPDRIAGSDLPLCTQLLQRGGLFVGFRPPGFDGDKTDDETFYLDVAAGADALLVPGCARNSFVREVAAEMTRWGRDVFAVPGSIHAPSSKGPHLLIRQGAKLVESVRDLTEELPVKNFRIEKEFV